MITYQKGDILAIYKKLMGIATRYSRKKKWKKGVDYLSLAAKWAYQFNYFYTDDEAESLIKFISENVVKPIELPSTFKGKYVLIDSFCFDNRGLTQQYLRAMIHNEFDILYICTANKIDRGGDIIRELTDYPHAQILLFTDDTPDAVRIANSIAEAVSSYSPAHIFLHIAPWDVAALIACAAIKGPTIYNINLTDHAYWMGASLIDYNMEFRPYGMTVSIENRGLKKDQLLGLPFYPVEPIGHPFRGLPPVPKGSVKILTGGAVYKMLGKDDIFFRMMELLLSIAPNVYIFVAGFSSDTIFEEKCSRIIGHERVILIGARDDIDAVFQNCDLFLSTYPTSGGLMCQYAAKYGKPILAYRDKSDMENAVEEMVNHFGTTFRTYTDLNDMIAYAKALITDEDFRNNEGELLKLNMMTPERFFESFALLMSEGHNNVLKWERDAVSYDDFSEHYLELENTGNNMATRSLLLESDLLLFVRIGGYRMQLLKCWIEIVRDAIVKRIH